MAPPDFAALVVSCLNIMRDNDFDFRIPDLSTLAPSLGTLPVDGKDRVQASQFLVAELNRIGVVHEVSYAAPVALEEAGYGARCLSMLSSLLDDRFLEMGRIGGRVPSVAADIIANFAPNLVLETIRGFHTYVDYNQVFNATVLERTADYLDEAMAAYKKAALLDQEALEVGDRIMLTHLIDTQIPLAQERIRFAQVLHRVQARIDDYNAGRVPIGFFEKKAMEQAVHSASLQMEMAIDRAMAFDDQNLPIFMNKDDLYTQFRTMFNDMKSREVDFDQLLYQVRPPEVLTGIRVSHPEFRLSEFDPGFGGFMGSKRLLVDQFGNEWVAKFPTNNADFAREMFGYKLRRYTGLPSLDTHFGSIDLGGGLGVQDFIATPAAQYSRVLYDIIDDDVVDFTRRETWQQSFGDAILAALTRDTDRHSGNFLYTRAGNLLPIDFGFANIDIGQAVYWERTVPFSRVVEAVQRGDIDVDEMADYARDFFTTMRSRRHEIIEAYADAANEMAVRGFPPMDPIKIRESMAARLDKIEEVTFDRLDELKADAMAAQGGRFHPVKRMADQEGKLFSTSPFERPGTPRERAVIGSGQQSGNVELFLRPKSGQPSSLMGQGAKEVWVDQDGKEWIRKVARSTNDPDRMSNIDFLNIPEIEYAGFQVAAKITPDSLKHLIPRVALGGNKFSRSAALYVERFTDNFHDFADRAFLQREVTIESLTDRLHAAIMDYILGDTDRHANNYAFLGDRFIAIDRGASFNQFTKLRAGDYYDFSDVGDNGAFAFGVGKSHAYTLLEDQIKILHNDFKRGYVSEAEYNGILTQLVRFGDEFSRKYEDGIVSTEALRSDVALAARARARLDAQKKVLSGEIRVDEYPSEWEALTNYYTDNWMDQIEVRVTRVADDLRHMIRTQTGWLEGASEAIERMPGAVVTVEPPLGPVVFPHQLDQTNVVSHIQHLDNLLEHGAYDRGGIFRGFKGAMAETARLDEVLQEGAQAKATYLLADTTEPAADAMVIHSELGSSDYILGIIEPDVARSQGAAKRVLKEIIAKADDVGKIDEFVVYVEDQWDKKLLEGLGFQQQRGSNPFNAYVLRRSGFKAARGAPSGATAPPMALPAPSSGLPPPRLLPKYPPPMQAEELKDKVERVAKVVAQEHSKSNWRGRVGIIRKGESNLGQKEWNCTINIRQDRLENPEGISTIVHEYLHSVSHAAHPSVSEMQLQYGLYPEFEEGVIQAATQFTHLPRVLSSLEGAKGLPPGWQDLGSSAALRGAAQRKAYTSAYSGYVADLENVRQALGHDVSWYDDLLRKQIVERYEEVAEAFTDGRLKGDAMYAAARLLSGPDQSVDDLIGLGLRQLDDRSDELLENIARGEFPVGEVKAPRGSILPERMQPRARYKSEAEILEDIFDQQGPGLFLLRHGGTRGVDMTNVDEVFVTAISRLERAVISEADKAMLQRRAEQILDYRRAIRKIVGKVNDPDSTAHPSLGAVATIGPGETYDTVMKADELIAASMNPAEARLNMRVRPNVLRRILKDGKFKNQHQTQTSLGLLDPDTRKSHELVTYGIPREAPPRERPLFGYITSWSPEEEFFGSMRQYTVVDTYGSIIVKFKDRVKVRTTFTLGDSLGQDKAFALYPGNLRASAGFAHLYEKGRLRDTEEYLLSRVSDHVTFKDQSKFDFGIATRMKDFVEAQYHGGLTLDDIEEVFIERRSAGLWPDQLRELTDELRKAGVKYSIVDRSL